MEKSSAPFCKKYYPMVALIIIVTFVNIAYLLRLISFNLFLAISNGFAWFVTFMLMSWQQSKEHHSTSSKNFLMLGIISFISIFLWYNS